MKTPTLTFCTGVETVTGANFLLKTQTSNILIDCGLVQGERVAEDMNKEPFPYDLSSITALFITHGHLDHVGRIPKIVKEGYTGPIYSTPQTKDIAALVLADAANILAMEARQEGTEPLYLPEDVNQVFTNWKTIRYHENFTLNEEISVFFKDAGHILGSAMIEFSLKTTGKILNTSAGSAVSSVPAELASLTLRSDSPRSLENSDPASSVLKILFTGDLGNSPAPLLRDTEPVGDVDYIIMESVYGDKNHEDKEGRTNKFKKIIEESIARGGTLVIPAFSIDRTQVLLAELNNMVEEGTIPSVPVYVDSPLATKATEIYRTNTELFNDKVQQQIRGGDDVFRFPRLQYTMSQGQSRDIEHMKGAKIILAGSGMSVGGRIVGHEEQYLPDEKSTILLVGYQTAGSLGRQLADGAHKVRIHGQVVKVKAHIETLYGYSAHKDSDHLVEFVATGTDRLKKVFTVMGEPRASMHLAQRINDELGVEALVPKRNEPYELK